MFHTIESQLLDYLNFRNSDAPCAALDEQSWSRALATTDTAGLTFHLLAKLRRLGHVGNLPQRVQERLARNERDHTARVMAMSSEFVEFNRLLQSRSIRYLTLKGLTYWPDFVDSIDHRVQYDHDFLVDPDDVQQTSQLFAELGYTPLESPGELAVDHLPTLVKKTGWAWKGNLYDPDIPRAVELHFQLWNSDFELIPIRFPMDVWTRAIQQSFQGKRVPTLCLQHTLLYGILHVFRHLLRNDLRLSHLYEISYFLETHVTDSAFWEDFAQQLQTCPQSLKAAATVLELARHCFGNCVPPRMDAMIREHLPPAGALWIERFGKKEALHCFRKSKSALLLHLAFVGGSRWKLLRRKWIPRHWPLPSFGVQVPEAACGAAFRLRQRIHYVIQIVKRAGFHVSELARFVFEFPSWQWQLHSLRARDLAAHRGNTREDVPKKL
ncbi:MAG: nucleotidyltransferase family protein [Acidobacteria bacterium]|nr:nucleotidyltransferase family protein [Acidobacteriota bacterium]MCI0723767.1 nucleotidyltransferase family protein [Acidobacteriota bacterium]